MAPHYLSSQMKVTLQLAWEAGGVEVETRGGTKAQRAASTWAPLCAEAGLRQIWVCTSVAY